MTTFEVLQRYLDGFQCKCDGEVYHVMTVTMPEGPQTHIWTWLVDEDNETDGIWDFHRVIPKPAMSHIALELWLTFDILLPDHDYLSPSETARKRAVRSALEAYGYVHP